MTSVLQTLALHPQDHATAHGATVESRQHQRSLSVYRLVRITSRDDEGFARVRNISDAGMKLELTMKLAPGEPIEVAFSEDSSLPARVVWTNTRECGVAFNDPVDSAALLAASAIEVQENPRRSLQLSPNVPATFEFDGHRWPARIEQMSLRDMRVRHDGGFHPGLRVRLILGGGREASAVVRWTDGDYADVCLIEPFGVDDLGSVRCL